jgi:thiopeptide-type bacteriocin biosynthesis protein
MVRRALAVGSLSLLGALERATASGTAADRARSRFLRYLIRMSTRPTPFGLFAGVAIGYWGSSTDIRIEPEIRTRTRPDMAWLMNFVFRLEARPEIRTELKVFANTAAFVHSGRVFLAERAPSLDTRPLGAVSVRATNVVKQALSAASTPIFWRELAGDLLASTPGATLKKVDTLLNELWAQTLILTELRPPLTHDDPARYVAERLARIPAAADERSQLESVLAMARDWDAHAETQSAESYQRMVAHLQATSPRESQTPLQVDSNLRLSGNRISRAVGEEAARAAELLLRIAPSPEGPSHIEAYRSAFELRYGYDREVPLLELLDQGLGLGPPAAYATGQYPPPGAVSTTVSMARSQALLNLACAALRDRQTVVELDSETLKCLETPRPSVDAPASLDLYVSVAAASAQALDRGEFKVVLGPNLGSTAAGRSLGRFADMIGAEARSALESAARTEEAGAPEKLWAELVYQPRSLRSANVSIRPAVRKYEIVWSATPGVAPENVIPIHEIVVGIRAGRFYLRWPAVGAEVVVCAGHMLNNYRAPVVCRFLSDLTRDRQVQLSPFGWGPASNFPFLPRVEVGRVVLRPARWRIDAVTRATQLSANQPGLFRNALGLWRAAWNVPRHVYLSSGDNRLLLDLGDPPQAEELRQAVKVLPANGNLALEEVYPSLDEAWAEGPEGHYVTELVVSLALREPPRASDEVRPARQGGFGHVVVTPSEVQGSERTPVTAVAHVLPFDRPASSAHARLRPPGSEWLYLKLYCHRQVEDDLIGGPIRDLGEQMLGSELAKDWFFVRYSDPDPHLRIRFRGDAEQLAGDGIHRVCVWAAELMSRGSCQRFSFDTYDRELERYGGPQGTAVAEEVFGADSRAVAQILNVLQSRRVSLDRTNVAVLTVDALLHGLGLSEVARLEWCRSQLRSRQEASLDYRHHKASLRSLLGDPEVLRGEPGDEELLATLVVLREQLRPLVERLHTEDALRELTRPPANLHGSFVHLHFNRIGIDRRSERTVLGLLWRVRQSLIHCPRKSGD